MTARGDPTARTTWREWALRLKREVHALALACRDPRVPWYAKTLAAVVAAYAFSPIDLIPDFIPVLGYVDDLILIPLGVLAVRALIPVDVMDECRARAAAVAPTRLMSRAGLVIVAGIWVVLTLAGVWVFVRYSWP